MRNRVANGLRVPLRSHSLWDGNPGPLYWLRQFIGDVRESYPYVNLSDGGHIENMGLYELLRRRCRYIVLVDGECDPGITCGSSIELKSQGIDQRFADHCLTTADKWIFVIPKQEVGGHDASIDPARKKHGFKCLTFIYRDDQCRRTFLTSARPTSTNDRRLTKNKFAPSTLPRAPSWQKELSGEHQ